jgi:hypothetical protein
MHSDKNSISDDSAVQYYFSEDYDYVLVRYLIGKPILAEVGATVPAGYAEVYHDGKRYFIRIEQFGKVDASSDQAGTFHTIISFDSIVGLFKK